MADKSNEPYKHARFRSVRPLRKDSPLTKQVRRLLRDPDVIVIQVGFGFYVFTTGEYNRSATKELYDWGTELHIIKVSNEEIEPETLFKRVIDERTKLGQENH